MLRKENEQSEQIQNGDPIIPVNNITGSTHIGDGDSTDPPLIPKVDPYANWMIWGPETNHQYIAIKKLYKSGNTYYADIYCMLSDYRLDGGTIEISYENGVTLGESYKYVDAIEMRGILTEFEQYNLVFDTSLNIFRHKTQNRAAMGMPYYYIEDNIVKKGIEDAGTVAYHHAVMHNYFLPCELKHIADMQNSFKNTPVKLLTGITQ